LQRRLAERACEAIQRALVQVYTHTSTYIVISISINSYSYSHICICIYTEREEVKAERRLAERACEALQRTLVQVSNIYVYTYML